MNNCVEIYINKEIMIVSKNNTNTNHKQNIKTLQRQLRMNCGLELAQKEIVELLVNCSIRQPELTIQLIMQKSIK